MAQAEFKEAFNVGFEKLWDVITNYKNYPKFVEGCRSTEVIKTSQGAQVKYVIEVMGKEMSYALDLHENKSQGQIQWKLLESSFFKKNSGGWELKALTAVKTDIRYWVELEFIVPVPGFVLNRLIKGSLPTLVKNFVKQAQGH